jgi:hypothetical protein
MVLELAPPALKITLFTYVYSFPEESSWVFKTAPRFYRVMLSLLGSRIILNLRGMILKDHEEIVTDESMKLVATGKSSRTWNTNSQRPPLPQPVQSSLITFVESSVGKKDDEDW